MFFVTLLGQLIELNLDLVETAINQVRSAVASQIGWDEIEEFLQEAQEDDDPVACAIKELKLKTNQIVMFLVEPSWDGFDQSDTSDDEDEIEDVPLSARIEIDLGLSAYGNAKAYYDSKKDDQTCRKVCHSIGCDNKM